MNFSPTSINGVFLIEPFFHEDERGTFIKTFHEDTFKEKGLVHDFRESFFSSSRKNVIRGMHFQLPPYQHTKLVFCMAGEVKDVVVDLRKDSSTYGQYADFLLTASNRNMLYIPEGCAHGFTALTDDATLFYFVSGVNNREADTGIRYDSFGYDWQTKNPIVSARDNAFVSLADFDSPF